MKNLITAFILLFTIVVNGQNAYKKHFPKGKLSIQNVNEVTIEAYNGDELIITTDLSGHNNCNNCNHSKSKKTKGLKLINGVGEMDNTGLGLRVEENKGTITITQISSGFNSVDARIKVPRDVAIHYKNSHVAAEDLIIKNVSSEIEVTQVYGDVELLDVTGPMAVQLVYGDVVAKFEKLNQTGSISINSTYGDADITMPSESKVNLLMKTGYGEAYTAFDIKLDKTIVDSDKEKLSQTPTPPPTPTPPAPSSSNGFERLIEGFVQNIVETTTSTITSSIDGNMFGSYIKGTINGGGVDFIVRCTYGDIYLRSE